MWKNIEAGATSLCSCLLTNHAGTGLLRSGIPEPVQNSTNINLCTVAIQDKPKTRFGKLIHGVLAYYINGVHFEHKKLRTVALMNLRQNLKVFFLC